MIQKSSKKKIYTVLIVALVSVIVISGMLAYLTDRDSDANVFTLGNVEIDLIEEYVQGSELKPGIDVKKEAWIKNTGKSDAWVWMTIAVPAALDGDETGRTILHWNGPTDTAWKTSEIPMQVTEIAGEEYNLYTLIYDEELTPGAETSLGLHKVYLDKNVDSVNDKYSWVAGGNSTLINYDIANVKVYVRGYAIQKEGFETVIDAYNAFQTQWTEN